MQKIINELKLDFDDVLIRPKRSLLKSRQDVSLTRDFVFTNSSRQLSCVPIVVANMDSVGTMAVSESLCKTQKTIVCLHKHYSIASLTAFYDTEEDKSLVFYSTGTGIKDIEKMTMVFNDLRLKNRPLPNVCIDVANGYTEKFVKTVTHIRKLYEEVIIMAGNVVTPEMVEELIIHGKADIVKVGIGSGSVCTTRLKTGVGYPQLAAILECSDAAHGLGGHICGDGGCKTIGDVCKAFGANGDFVMLGSLLAGCEECEGEWEYEYLIEDMNRWQPFDPGYQTKKRKTLLKFYGMSSKNAMDKYSDGIATYKTSEGKCVNIPYKGLATDIIQDIYGGIRSACTYVGANKIKDFGKKTTFVMVNNTHNRIFEK